MIPQRIIANDFAARAAEWIAASLRDIVAHHGRCALALAGGRTPGPAYRKLAELPRIPWQHVSLFFADERAVAPEHPDSNYRYAFDTLLSRVPVPSSQIHRMEAERPDREQAARDYEARLPDSLDLLLLGMGADGHIASLFPHSPALAEAVRRVVPVNGGAPPMPRLSITPPVVRNAASILVMVAGEAKAAQVARVLQGPENVAELPAQLARNGTWLLDSAAASQLAATPR
jgi:6-phosphogluconolactonase